MKKYFKFTFYKNKKWVMIKLIHSETEKDAMKQADKILKDNPNDCDDWAREVTKIPQPK